MGEAAASEGSSPRQQHAEPFAHDPFPSFLRRPCYFLAFFSWACTSVVTSHTAMDHCALVDHNRQALWSCPQPRWRHPLLFHRFQDPSACPGVSSDTPGPASVCPRRSYPCFFLEFLAAVLSCLLQLGLCVRQARCGGHDLGCSSLYRWQNSWWCLHHPGSCPGLPGRKRR